jgi:ABC-type xylose transport system permease subunit
MVVRKIKHETSAQCHSLFTILVLGSIECAVVAVVIYAIVQMAQRHNGIPLILFVLFTLTHHGSWMHNRNKHKTLCSLLCLVFCVMF